MDANSPHEDNIGSDTAIAERVVQVHCPIAWPEGSLCLNCNQGFPCPRYEWAYRILSQAGRSEDEISKLDRRTGPWS